MLFIATRLLTFKTWRLLCCSIDSILLSYSPNVTFHLSFPADLLTCQCHLIMPDTFSSVTFLRLSVVMPCHFYLKSALLQCPPRVSLPLQIASLWLHSHDPYLDPSPSSPNPCLSESPLNLMWSQKYNSEGTQIRSCP